MCRHLRQYKKFLSKKLRRDRIVSWSRNHSYLIISIYRDFVALIFIRHHFFYTWATSLDLVTHNKICHALHFGFINFETKWVWGCIELLQYFSSLLMPMLSKSISLNIYSAQVVKTLAIWRHCQSLFSLAYAFAVWYVFINIVIDMIFCKSLYIDL